MSHVLRTLPLAVTLFAAGCGADDSATVTRAPAARTATSAPKPKAAAPEPPAIVVRDGRPDGGVRKLRFERGGTIDLTVRSDTAQDVHLHGYDVHRLVPEGGSARFRVPARIEGIFELELEDSGTKVASIEVVP